MKCQRNASPIERVLALQVLRPVLTCDRDPGVGEDAHVLGRHVLRRRDDGDAGAGLRADGVVRRADRVGVHASSRAARSSSQSRVLRAGLVDDVGEEIVQDATEVRPFGEPDRAEVVAGDGEVGQMVRL